ncbi:hypothetical protein ACHQM5_014082 [Ranunculus cassubicifolius]
MAPGMIVSPILRVLLDKLSSLITRKFYLLQGFNEDLMKLFKILSSIESFLVDAERKHISHRRAMLITYFNDAAYAAEDLLEEIEIEALTWESAITEMTCVSESLLSAHLKIGNQIEELIERFRLHPMDAGSFNSYWVNKSSAVNNPLDDFVTKTNEIPTAPIIYGRERETENMIQVLLNNNNNHRLSICPILGIAGVGKTTLAQFVYGDERIVHHFDARIWVSVVDDFDVSRITRVMIEKLSKERCHVVNRDLMQNNLNRLLNRKKFLVVLDDVWNDDRKKWNKITHLLAWGAKGSSIIVTTRLRTVVDNVANLSTSCVLNPTYDLLPLHEDDAWSLFKCYANGVRDEDLIEIGKVVVAKCKGIPRHIKKAADLLRSRGKLFWSITNDGKIWDPEQLEKSTVRLSLKLRYYNLSPIYRQCFAYCFIFPKGYEIEVEKLIELWIANGFVQTKADANGIFRELVTKSFFPYPEENWLGIKIFKMQDFAHNLAWLVARTECVALEDGDQLSEIPESVRHLLVSDGAQSSGMVETISKSFPHLRTCIFPPMYTPPLPIIFENLASLRALHLRGSNIPNLPRSIENLKHLRYLNLSSSVELRFLPESICSLRYLQTLELSHCWKLETLPKSLSKLINLRYLYLSDCRSLIQLPDGIGALINLRHLDLSECDSLMRIPDSIGQLSNLRHLDLHDCETFSRLPHVIGQLTNLIYLDISRCPNLKGLPHGIANLVNLRRLNLSKQLLEVTHLPLLEFILGSDSVLSIGDLHGLNNLKGELQIRGLGLVKNGAEAKKANLVAKKNVSSLSLVWEDLYNNNNEEVIQCLRPPRNLNNLVIEGYRGSVFPSWVKLLMNVVEIQLLCCSECEELPPLGHLPLLKKLCIFGIHSLKRVNMEFYGIVSSSSEADTSQGKGCFPSLKELEFREMPNWVEWQEIDGVKVFLCLQKLRLDKCPNLALLPIPIQRSVQKFEITGCEKLMVISSPI